MQSKNTPIASVAELGPMLDYLFAFADYFSTLKYASTADTNFEAWTADAFNDGHSLD